MPPPFHHGARDQQQTDETGGCDVPLMVAKVVVVQDEKAQGVGHRFVEEPAEFIAPVMFESDSSGFDEYARGVQHDHDAVGQPQRGEDESDVDGQPANGLRDVAPALHDQRGRQRYDVEHGARLVNQRAHDHEA